MNGLWLCKWWWCASLRQWQWWMVALSTEWTTMNGGIYFCNWSERHVQFSGTSTARHTRQKKKKTWEYKEGAQECGSFVFSLDTYVCLSSKGWEGIWLCRLSDVAVEYGGALQIVVTLKTLCKISDFTHWSPPPSLEMVMKYIHFRFVSIVCKYQWKALYQWWH